MKGKLNIKYCRAGGEGQFLEFKILIALGIIKKKILKTPKTDFITDDS